MEREWCCAVALPESAARGSQAKVRGITGELMPEPPPSVSRTWAFRDGCGRPEEFFSPRVDHWGEPSLRQSETHDAARVDR